jgi:hypothetical protein
MVRGMRHLDDGPFTKGQDVWVVDPGGGRRAAEYVGQAETNDWFGGAPTVIVVFPDDASSGLVELDRVLPRD